LHNELIIILNKGSELVGIKTSTWEEKSGSYRWRVDYHAQNCLQGCFLPRINSCLDASVKWFSTFDLRWAYQQVTDNPTDADNTAFIRLRGCLGFLKYRSVYAMLEQLSNSS